MSTSVRSGAASSRSATGQSGRPGRRPGTATVRGRSAAEAAAADQRRRTTTRSISAETTRSGRARRPAPRGSSSPIQAVGRMVGLGGNRTRTGGVAPFVPPSGRLGRRLKLREWSRRGFVPLSPGRQKLRHRILPRTVIGISTMLLAAGIGAAFSGAAFYAYYDDRLAENERTVARFVEGFDQQFTDAAGALDEMRIEAVGTIRDELGPLEDYVSDADGVISLPAAAGPSVWLVETRDEQGRLRTGSAFAIIGHEGGTALVTSYSVVLASTTEPGPGIELLKGSERIPAQLWSWDEERDLALLVVDRPIPVLAMAGERAQIGAVGRRVFAISGFGGQGATASPGVLLDRSQVGLQHTAPIGTMFIGGPLLDGDGRVLGMASAGYNPFGVDPGDVHQAPDVRAICTEILRCSEVAETMTAEVTGDQAEGAAITTGTTGPSEDGLSILEVEPAGD